MEDKRLSGRAKRIMASRPFRSVEDLASRGIVPADVLAAVAWLCDRDRRRCRIEVAPLFRTDLPADEGAKPPRSPEADGAGMIRRLPVRVRRDPMVPLLADIGR